MHIPEIIMKSYQKSNQKSLGGTNHALPFVIQKVLVFPKIILDPNDIFKCDNDKWITRTVQFCLELKSFTQAQIQTQSPKFFKPTF